MTYQPSIFDTPVSPTDFLELGPYEIESDRPIERVRIRRGQPIRPAPATLTGDQIGMLAVAGAVTATAIAFLIDPAGATAALLSIVGL